ncbi:MAG: ABC transporter permease [Anaerolineaceae bacterium]|jgi:putative ABC transport system permease protein|nr:ABC transporter permease [Anaerolineaceae bacterium]
MKFFDLVNLILYNLSRRKGRVALTAVGVVIGTAAVVVLVSLAVGLQKNATNQLWGINDLTSIEVYQGYSSSSSGGVSVRMMGGGGGGDDGINYLTPKAIQSIAAIPNVKQVITEDYLQTGADIVYGKLHAYGNIMGVDTPDLANMGLEADQGVTTLDKGTAIIGGWVPNYFYDPKARPNDPPVTPPDLLGQSLKFVLTKYDSEGNPTTKTLNIKIVGVLKETRGQSDGSIYMRLDDITALNEWARGTRINRNKEGYSMLLVKASDTQSVLDIADTINNMGFQASTPQSTVQSINSFFMVLQVIFGGVGAIALLVAAIGIANTMTMAILERTKEIGLMKAIGAKNKDIMSIFLGEAAGIGFVGGLGGVILGWGSSALLNVVALSYFASQASSGSGSMPTMATSTPFWLPFFALAFATIIGFFSGLYPAMRAASLVPVAALKYE